MEICRINEFFWIIISIESLIWKFKWEKIKYIEVYSFLYILLKLQIFIQNEIMFDEIFTKPPKIPSYSQLFILK